VLRLAQSLGLYLTDALASLQETQAAGCGWRKKKGFKTQINADARRCTQIELHGQEQRSSPGAALGIGRGWSTDHPSACISVHLLVSALILSCFAAYRTSLHGEVQNHIQ
jgi:hypothetical protein